MRSVMGGGPRHQEPRRSSGNHGHPADRSSLPGGFRPDCGPRLGSDPPSRIPSTGRAHRADTAFSLPGSYRSATDRAAPPAGQGSIRTVTLMLRTRTASIFISRSRVNRPGSALRTREKSAAAKPVRLAALRTESPRSSGTAMMRAARMALACFRSASGSSKSRKTFPLPYTSSKSLSVIAPAPCSIVRAVPERGRSRLWAS